MYPSRGLSESLVSPRRPNIRRSNEYVKIKPRSMEVVTTTVQEEEQHQQQQPAAAAAAVNGAAAAQPPEEEGHYSSIDDLVRMENIKLNVSQAAEYGSNSHCGAATPAGSGR